MKILTTLIIVSFLLLLTCYVLCTLSVGKFGTIPSEIVITLLQVNLFAQPLLLGVSSYKIQRKKVKWPLLLLLNISILFYLIPTALLCVLLVCDYLYPHQFKTIINP